MAGTNQAVCQVPLTDLRQPRPRLEVLLLPDQRLRLPVQDAGGLVSIARRGRPAGLLLAGGCCRRAGWLGPCRRGSGPIGSGLHGPGWRGRRARGRRPGCRFRQPRRWRAGSDGEGGGRDRGRHEQRGRRHSQRCRWRRGRGRGGRRRWRRRAGDWRRGCWRRLRGRDGWRRGLVSARRAVASTAQQQRRGHGGRHEQDRRQPQGQRGSGGPPPGRCPGLLPGKQAPTRQTFQLVEEPVVHHLFDLVEVCFERRDALVPLGRVGREAPEHDRVEFERNLVVEVARQAELPDGQLSRHRFVGDDAQRVEVGSY